MSAHPEGLRGAPLEAGESKFGWRRNVLCRLEVAVVLGTCVFLLLGCSSAQEPVTPGASSRPAAGVRDYLLNPLQSFDLSVGAETAVRLDQGFDALIQRGQAEVALRIAKELLSRNDSLQPAIVLSAQVSFVAGDYRRVIKQLSQVAVESPDYQAAILLLARSHDLLGEELEAYTLYRQAGSGSIGERRGSTLSPKVMEIMTGALAAALLEDSLDVGLAIAQRIEEYFPDSVQSFEASRDVARARDDGASELAARRSLARIAPASRADQERLAKLEVALGDPTQGLEILQRLVAETPGDYALLEALDAAKFSWRLTMLPPEVASIVDSEELTRAEFATLLYWVVPGVRSGASDTARIAVDIPVGHARRREVVRVLNMGIMPMVDPALRRFAPEARMEFGNALDILLRLPQRFDVSTACSKRYVKTSRSALRVTCDAAVRCGLVSEPEACLLGEGMSGNQAKEVVRRTLNLLGGPRP